MNAQAIMDLLHALSDENDRLSALEKKLAGLVLDDIDFAVNASISDLARRAGVSPPTVTRFCRHLGCEGYADFRVQLMRLAYVGRRYLRPATPAESPAEIAGDIISAARTALADLQGQLDMALLTRAAHLLRGAEFIYAFGASGNSAMIVNELHNRLFRLGCRVSPCNDHNMNIMLSASTLPGTVALGSSFTGRDTGLVECLMLLRQRGVPTIAITQSHSPVAAAADVVITIDLPEGDNIFKPTSTRYAYLATIDILANLVACADRTLSARMLRSIKQELVLRRDGDNRQVLGD